MFAIRHSLNKIRVEESTNEIYIVIYLLPVTECGALSKRGLSFVDRRAPVTPDWKTHRSVPNWNGHRAELFVQKDARRRVDGCGQCPSWSPWPRAGSEANRLTSHISHVDRRYQVEYREHIYRQTQCAVQVGLCKCFKSFHNCPLSNFS